jgi:hypothetical protein
MCLDGHVFRINYDVPEEITRQLYKLYELYDRDAKYEEIPEHLTAYEIEREDSDVEEAKELERYLEEEAKRKKKDLEAMKAAISRPSLLVYQHASDRTCRGRKEDSNDRHHVTDFDPSTRNSQINLYSTLRVSYGSKSIAVQSSLRIFYARMYNQCND